MAVVGIIANPSAGKDIRRLVAHGRVVSNQEKSNILRRVFAGVASTDTKKILIMPDHSGLSISAAADVSKKLEVEYPEFFWTPRITFAGLLDVPDKNGETKTQGPVIAMGIDFFSKESRQVEIWELEKNIVQR